MTFPAVSDVPAASPIHLTYCSAGDRAAKVWPKSFQQGAWPWFSVPDPSHISQVSLMQQGATSTSQWETFLGARKPQLWGVPAAPGDPSGSGESQQLNAAVLKAVEVELLHSTNRQLIRTKTGGSDKSDPNTMCIFSLQLFSGSQNDSLKQEVSFKIMHRCITWVPRHPPASDGQKRL